MMIEKKIGSVHEPEAELHSADDAIQDSARLRALYGSRRAEHAIPVRVPFSALLEAIDCLESDELKEAMKRAEKRLEAIGAK